MKIFARPLSGGLDFLLSLFRLLALLCLALSYVRLRHIGKDLHVFCFVFELSLLSFVRHPGDGLGWARGSRRHPVQEKIGSP